MHQRSIYWRTTINSLDDFLRALDANPSWREAVRTRILGEELLQLPVKFDAFAHEQGKRLENVENLVQAGIPQIKPPFLDIAPAGIPPNIMPHSKGVKCGLIHSNSTLSLGNHCTAKRKSPKPLVYAQVSPLGSSFALCDPVTVTNPDAPKVD